MIGDRDGIEKAGAAVGKLFAALAVLAMVAIGVAVFANFAEVLFSL